MAERQLTDDPTPSRVRLAILLGSVLIIATGGILYELLISSMGTYFLGESVLQFSLTIGFFMSAMGLGSYLSRFVRTGLLSRFVEIELLLGIVGGCSAILLHLGYAYLPQSYQLLSILLIVLLGTGIGLEIPLMSRIVRRYTNLRETLANVLSVDYLGSLVAALLFPLVLLPFLGSMRTSFLVGALNVLVAGVNTWVFRRELPHPRQRIVLTGLAFLGLLAGFLLSFRLVGFFEARFYRDEVVLSEQTPYQKIVLTRWRQDYRLFLNGNLQFSTQDEYRYHEPLVHLPLLAHPRPKQVLILGGGDGFAAREALKHKHIKRVDLVDLDSAVTRLALRHPVLSDLNDEALQDPRVHLAHQDAFKFLEHAERMYDVVLIDLPDPNSASIGRLYSRSFYRLLQHRLAPGGVAVTQSSSPYFAREAFWCIHHTIEDVFARALPYTTYVPSFGGVWGFNLVWKPLQPSPPGTTAPSDSADASAQATLLARVRQRLKERGAALQLNYLSEAALPAMLALPKDLRELPTELNTLHNQQLVRYYEGSWERWE